MTEQRTDNDLQPWTIRSAGDLSWACRTYEKDIQASRKKGRFLFNQLFEFGKKQIEGEVNIGCVKFIGDDNHGR